MVFFAPVILLPEVVPVVPELVTVLPEVVLDVTLGLEVTVVGESGGLAVIVATLKACWLGAKAPETTVSRTSVG